MSSKKEFYSQIISQTTALIKDETDFIANMANISAILFEALDNVNWVGFYRVVNDELILGPFQGKVACVHIPVGKGVCGTAVSNGKTQRIADVHQFHGHIACDATTNSEIVIPVKFNDDTIAVLDIDSQQFSRFDEMDEHYLELLINQLQLTLSCGNS